MSDSTSTALALAAAALFLGGCSQQASQADTQNPDQAADAAAPAGEQAAAAPDANKKVKCFGINECSGQSACDVPDNRVEAGSVGHSCAGQNECKGKGWILKTQAECDETGGELL